MFGFEDIIREWLIEASHHPEYLYFSVVLFLTLSSFGLPFPEELVLITSGMVASVAMMEAAELGRPSTINPITLALTCLFAVLISDFLVFFLGRKYGVGLIRSSPFSKVISSKALDKVEIVTQKYGFLACGFFRFTPGLRFPGHFMCGALKISYTKFFLSDGTAALISVPTQVLLLAYYGDEIVKYFKQFKLGIVLVAVLLLAFWLIRRKILSAPKPVS